MKILIYTLGAEWLCDLYGQYSYVELKHGSSTASPYLRERLKAFECWSEAFEAFVKTLAYGEVLKISWAARLSVMKL